MSRRHSGYSRQFSQFIRRRRGALGLTLRALEARTGIHNSRLGRWERDEEAPSGPDRLAALARGLEVTVADLYAVAGIELPELPFLPLYLRAKYGAVLPEEALAEIAGHAEEVAQRYGVSLKMPDMERASDDIAA
ncbi:MAG TPA: helix-turn-helix transcriptional regulator [Acidimicrobiales bacterium]|jgi:transcriptional regulator with XRE-family HTH domain|nr:helix-turn-helix transcriptional regulator [Acidimicrobiales bacterium]